MQTIQRIYSDFTTLSNVLAARMAAALERDRRKRALELWRVATFRMLDECHDNLCLDDRFVRWLQMQLELDAERAWERELDMLAAFAADGKRKQQATWEALEAQDALKAKNL